MSFGLLLEIFATPLAVGIYFLGLQGRHLLGFDSEVLPGFVATWLVALIYGFPKIQRVCKIKQANWRYFLESTWISWAVLILVASAGGGLVTTERMSLRLAGFTLIVLWMALNTGFALVFRETIRIMWSRTRPLGLLSVLGLTISILEKAPLGWQLAFGVGILLTLFATFLGFHGELETWWSYASVDEKSEEQSPVP